MRLRLWRRTRTVAAVATSADNAPVSRRTKRLVAELGPFMQQYERKKRPGQGEPNDRHYDRKLERAVKRMDPAQLDALLRGESDEDDTDAAA